MDNEKYFQEQIRQLGKLVMQFDQLPDSDAKSAGRELVQLLMGVHGKGLERTMEVIFASGDLGPGIIDNLGHDSIVGNLLLLYSLHPNDLETRVEDAVESMRIRLRKLGCTIELERVYEGIVQVRLKTSGHNCGSSTRELRTLVEDGIYEFAPDVTSIEILGLTEPASTNFVTLESLLGHDFAAASPAARTLERDGAD